MKNKIAINIALSQLDDYDNFGGTQGSTSLGHGGSDKKKNLEDSPFRIRKDVFMLAATCGFLKNQEEEIEGKKHNLFSTNTLDESDWAALYAMYIKYNDMDIALALEKKELVIRQAEKWAYSGLKFIKMHLDDDDYANIYNLSNWIIEKPEWYMKKKRS